MVTAPVPTDTWSRHSPRAGLVPGAGPSQLVHDHQEGLCHDRTVACLSGGCRELCSLSKLRPGPGGPQVRAGLWLLLSEHIHLRRPLFPHHHPHLPPPHLPPGLINSTAH